MDQTIETRDKFAGIVLNQMLNGASIPGLYKDDPEALEAVEMIAKCCYTVADAMMRARAVIKVSDYK